MFFIRSVKSLTSILLLSLCAIGTSYAAMTEGKNLGKVLGSTPRAKQTIARSELEYEANRLYERGEYELAIAKYRVILSRGDLTTKIEDKNGALIGIVRSKQMQGEYKAAYNANEELIKNNRPIEAEFIDWWGLRSLELLALMEFESNRTTEKIHQYLNSRAHAIKKNISSTEVSLDEKDLFRKSIYLYEVVQDYSAATKSCDEYLAMKKVKKDKKFKAEVEDLRRTILEAQQTRQKGIIFKKLNQYGFYNWL